MDHDIPKGWKMSKNALSEEFGDVPITNITDGVFHWPGTYRGQLISNPNMMFLFERFDQPLLDLDIQTWLLLALITGDIPTPSAEEMKLFEFRELLGQMDDPYARQRVEDNYSKRWGSISDDHWSYEMSDERTKQVLMKYFDLQISLLARDMVEAKYPLQIGTLEKLNEKGKAIVAFSVSTVYDRYGLDRGTPDVSLRTFRDANASNYYSIITGTIAAPLKSPWLDLNGNCVQDIVDTPKTDLRFALAFVLVILSLLFLIWPKRCYEDSCATKKKA